MGGRGAIVNNWRRSRCFCAFRKRDFVYGAGHILVLPWLLDKNAQRSGYMGVFEREKAGVKKTIDMCTNASPSTEIHFVIGNDPNAYPYIDPEGCAEVSHVYRSFIKNQNS